MKILQKGFTLIELIIVIAVLGILGVGLLAVLDPVEQLNKATDGAMRSKAYEVSRAIERYYAAKQAYPADVTALVTAGEIKAAAGITIGAVSPNKPWSCFTIVSKSFKTDPKTAYSALPASGTADPATGACTAGSTCTVWCDR